MICDFSDKKIGKKIGPRARWRGETRDFAEICSKSSLSASEIAKFSPAARSLPPIAKNQKFRRRNRYFGEAPAHECPIILYQENDSEGYETQKFSAARADACAYRSRRSAPRNTGANRVRGNRVGNGASLTLEDLRHS